jgi:hypothetical protein
MIDKIFAEKGLKNLLAGPIRPTPVFSNNLLKSKGDGADNSYQVLQKKAVDTILNFATDKYTIVRTHIGSKLLLRTELSINAWKIF